MLGSLADMSWLEKIFISSAIFGGGLLLIRLVLLFMGGDGEGDAGDADVGDVDVGDADVGDADVDDVDADGADGDAGSSDHAFRILSLQGISGFLLLFGLVGMGVYRVEGSGPLWATAAGIAAGCAMVWILGKLMISLKGLQSSGTINMSSAIGGEGKVYLRIPSGGIGKAQVPIQGRMKVYEARAEGDEELRTGDRIQVVKVVSGNILVVRKI